jgi:hypothetical protein
LSQGTVAGEAEQAVEKAGQVIVIHVHRGFVQADRADSALPGPAASTCCSVRPYRSFSK